VCGEKSGYECKSLEELMSLLDNVPELKKKNSDLSKHANITSNLNRLIDKKYLCQTSELEQDISTRPNQSLHFKQIK